MKKLYNLEFILNGNPVKILVEAGELLVDVLRNKLRITGVKKGCAEGECGSCTILLDEKPVYSCIIPAMKAQGKKIITIEGMSKHNKLHPIQEAFIEAGAVQCGFCTPGMILSTKALLDKNGFPSDDEIKQALSGHICRCTGYAQFVEAVKIATKRMCK